MRQFHLRLLGGFSLVKDEEELSGRATRKVEALLCILAVTGVPQSRSALAGWLWRDMTEIKAKGNLRRALSDLRKVVGELVVSNQQEIWLQQDWYELDVAAFSQPQESENLAQMQGRIDLYRGDFLDGFVVRNAPAFEEWLLSQQIRLRENAIELLYRIVESYRDLGDLAAGIAAARRLLEIDRWREEGHRQLMLLLAEDGQRTAALAQFAECHQLLHGEFGVAPGPETEKLYHRIKNGEVAVRHKAGPTAVGIPHNLPASPTQFVGRLQEMTRINELIADPEMRLISLVAAGGMGKTRLAIAIAQTHLNSGHFPHGVFFIAMAPISSAAGILPALAQAINLQLHSDAGRSQKRQILDYLRDKIMLLIFDNFEHLLAARKLLGEILQYAPDVTMMTTSRERLNLYGEHLYTLQGLALTKTENGEQWRNSEAVQLFLQSAKRVQPAFVLTEKDNAHLLAICKLVEGMPLALELAAGWVDTLSMLGILTEVEKSLGMLTTEMEGMPARHRSMEAVWQSTWSRLTAAEQVVFCALSIFKGGFTLAAINQVVETNPRQVQNLVNKCLLQFDPISKRYHIHELLRQFGFAKLAEDPNKLQLAQQQHVDFYLAQIKSCKARIQAPTQLDAVAEFKADFDNALLAIENAGSSQQFDALTKTLPSLIWLTQFPSQRTSDFNQTMLTLWQNLVGVAENDHLLLRLYTLVALLLDWGLWRLAAEETQAYHKVMQRLYVRFSDQPELAEAHPDLHFFVSKVEYSFDKRVKALSLAELAVERFQLKAEPFALGRALSHLGGLKIAFSGDFETAFRLLKLSLRIQNEVGDIYGKADTLRELGYIAWHQSRVEESSKYSQQLLKLAEQLGDKHVMANAQLNLGLTEWISGHPELALNTLKLCSTTLAQLGDEASLNANICFYSLSAAAIDAGQYAEGRVFAQRNIDNFHSPLITSAALDSLARIDLANNNKQRALSQCEEALKIKREVIQVDILTFNLAVKALIHASLDDFVSARDSLLECVSLCLKTRSYAITIALAALSLLKLGKGETAAALRFYAIANQFPYVRGSQWFTDVAGKHIEAEAHKLPQTTIQAARDEGQQADVWATAESILKQLKRAEE